MFDFKLVIIHSFVLLTSNPLLDHLFRSRSTMDMTLDRTREMQAVATSELDPHCLAESESISSNEFEKAWQKVSS